MDYQTHPPSSAEDPPSSAEDVTAVCRQVVAGSLLARLSGID
jgi:hypothetical protein